MIVDTFGRVMLSLGNVKSTTLDIGMSTVNCVQFVTFCLHIETGEQPVSVLIGNAVSFRVAVKEFPL